MAEVVEKTGKTVEEAYQAAITALGVAKEDTTCEVLEEPTKGFLGIIGSKLAKVRVTVKEKAEVKETEMAAPYDEEVQKEAKDEAAAAVLAEDFLRNIFAAMHLEVQVKMQQKDDTYIFDLVGEDLGILIGKHGQTLDSLQYLTNLAANRGVAENRAHIIIDIENYRSRREDTLRRLAFRLADKVKHTGEKVMLEPMNRHERKIIHMALQDNRRVTTYSAGEEPYRKVVIEPRHGEKSEAQAARMK